MTQGSSYSKFQPSSRTRMCFALVVVNVILIIGVIVAALRARTSVASPQPTMSTVASTPRNPSANVTKESSRVSLQGIMKDQNLPTHIREAIIKLDSFLRNNLNTTVSGSMKCQFAWRINRSTNATELFECKSM